MLSPLHFWSVFFGTGALFVFLAYWGARWRRLTPREIDQATGPAGCGNCGYNVRGLPSHVCPECGSDLNEVGRLAPRFRKWQNVPPMLRAVLYTAAVAVAAVVLTLLAVGAFRGVLLRPYAPAVEVEVDRFRGVHPSLMDASGTSLRVETVRELAERLDPFPQADELQWTTERYTALGRIYFAVNGGAQPLDHLRFEVDLLAGTWRAIDGRTGKDVESGTGVPSIEAVHRLVTDFAQARAKNFAQPTTVVVRGRQFVPLKESEGETTGNEPQFLDPGTISLRQAASIVQHLDIRRGGLRPDIEAIYRDEGGDSGVPWTGGSSGSGQSLHVPPLTWLWLACFWLLVLLTGLWFVTRRRTIRPKTAFGGDTMASDAGKT